MRVLARGCLKTWRLAKHLPRSVHARGGPEAKDAPVMKIHFGKTCIAGKSPGQLNGASRRTLQPYSAHVAILRLKETRRLKDPVEIS